MVGDAYRRTEAPNPDNTLEVGANEENLLIKSHEASDAGQLRGRGT